MHSNLAMRLSERLSAFLAALTNQNREQFEFKEIVWSNLIATGRGFSGPTSFRVSLNFGASSYRVLPACSICGYGQFCPHACALAVLMNDSGIAADIDENDYTHCSFSFEKQ